MEAFSHQDLHPTPPFSATTSSSEFPTPNLCSARFHRQNIEQYTPQRCLACGLTNKEFHQMLKDIHDPTDPNKCCLRGPRFIQDKQLKERLNQYNLKHPTDKGATELTKEAKELQEAKLPLPCNLPSANINKFQVHSKEQATTTQKEEGISYLDDEQILAMLHNQPDTNQQQQYINDINGPIYNEQTPVLTTDYQQQRSDLPIPQHNTLIPTNLPAHSDSNNLDLDNNNNNDWDLRQLEAYQDIVA